MKLYPFYEVAAAAYDAMQQGATIFQQFNCAHCGRLARTARLFTTAKISLHRLPVPFRCPLAGAARSSR